MEVRGRDIWKSRIMKGEELRMGRNGKTEGTNLGMKEQER
jgi:hypothetical protein